MLAHAGMANGLGQRGIHLVPTNLLRFVFEHVADIHVE
jgi:hypothetical protein